METTVLLPIVPTMVTKVHDDEDFSDSNYYKYICKQLQKLQEREKERQKQQQQQQQLQQKRFYQQFHLWLTPNESTYEDNNNRNDDYRNNVLQHQQRLQRTITIKEKRTKNQLQRQVQPEPEPKFEPEPEPQPQLNAQPEEPTSEEVLEEYDSKSVSFEFAKLDLQLENLNGKPEPKFELDEPDLSQLHQNLKPIESLPILKPEYSLYEENCSQKNELFNLRDFDSESISLPLPEKTIDVENRQFKTYCMARKLRLSKADIFVNRRSPYVILKPLEKRYRDFEEVYGDTVNKILIEINTKTKVSQSNSSVPSKSLETDSSVNTKSLETDSSVDTKSSEADSSVPSTSSEAGSPVLTKSSETNSPVASKSSVTDSSVTKSSEANSPVPSESSKTDNPDNCLHYMSDGDEEYTTRCKDKAAQANKEADEEYFKWLYSWKDPEPNDSFETDFFEDEADSRIAVKEEQQVNFRHVFNVPQLVMAHVSVPKPSLLKPSLSKASYTSSEVLSSSSKVSPSSLKTLSSPRAIKNPLNNENTNQRITRRKAEEIQQQLAYKIKKNTLIDHCYHQTNVPETHQVFKKELEESDEEGEIIDVESVKTGKEQVPFAMHYDLKCKRENLDEDLDEDQSSEPPVSRRPRGRPPGSTKRKANRSGPAPKRARIQNNVNNSNQQSEQPSASTSCQHQNSMRQCALQRDSSEDTERRRLHNDMERQRRIYMKESYEQLRKNVPAIMHNNKASKVSILKQGATYIKSLTEIGNTLNANVTHLKHQNEILKRKLQHLNTLGIRSSFS